MEKEHTLSERERELLEEIQEFNKERDRIRKVIGEIGGTRYSRRDTLVNVVFLTVILLLFISEVLTQWLPTFISIEVGILLVSIKIVWMIHAQQKYNHFVFWVLNSIEFRQNDLAMKLRSIEKKLEPLSSASREAELSNHSPLGNTPP
jgi:predicted signal transduction protein with EAL and GGDEF domain